MIVEPSNSAAIKTIARGFLPAITKPIKANAIRVTRQGAT
jgi:hypothetical protein